MAGLSKSKYNTYCQCPKRLWLQQYSPESGQEDPRAASSIAIGHQVGELAKGLFGEYVDVTTCDAQSRLDLPAMMAKTRQSLDQGAPVICEAAFSFADNYCAVDLLRKQDDGYAIYEVKSFTGNQPEQYFNDIAYQKWVLEQCGVRVTGTYLVHINSDYVLDGELDIHQFFTILDVTEAISSAYASVPTQVVQAHELLELTAEPAIPLNLNCQGCAFFAHCANHLPSPSVFNLYRTDFSKKLKYYEAGIISFQDLRNEALGEKQRRQVECTLQGTSHIDAAGIRQFMSQLSYPLYFLDFETMLLAIPQYQGTKPYQQIPFQYSLHYIEHEGGALHHREFLAESGQDPQRALAEQLCRDIPLNVCTTAYNKSFECTRLSELAKLYPDLADHLLNIRDHIVDLLTPFQSGMYYLPAMGGSFSIKSVLPALFPDDPSLNYHNLEGDVHNGSEAMTIFPLIQYMEPADQQRARQSLLKYCELDTYAMVKLWQKLAEV